MYKDKIKTAYSQYKKLAQSYYSKGELENCFTCLYYASSVMHAFQLQLVDDEIELLLKKAGTAVLKKEAISVQISMRKILMYDSIGTDNMALSLQYVSALSKLNRPYIYILCGKKEKAERILKQVYDCPFGEAIIIDPRLTYIEKIEELAQIVEELCPEKAILHMANSDVAGAALWSCVEGVERFFVNHGDEQFWVGTNTLDYLLCFRGMGVNTAEKYRNISKEKSLVLPYYPIISEIPFQGWQFEIPTDSVILFSGGRFKKIYGENNEFSKMVAGILKENPNTFFIFAGSGDSEPFQLELKKSGVENRCRVIPYRKDLSELMKHIDIYLGTYPQSGGLMAQYAANAGVPIVERDSLVGGISEELFPKLSTDVKISYQSIEEYYLTVKKLVESAKLRKKTGSLIQKGMVSRGEFENGLKSALDMHQSLYCSNENISNNELRSKRIIEADENSMHRFWGMLLNHYMLKTKFILFAKAFVMQIKFFGWHTVWKMIKGKKAGT